jgi:hypothetical protein
LFPGPRAQIEIIPLSWPDWWWGKGLDSVQKEGEGKRNEKKGKENKFVALFVPYDARNKQIKGKSVRTISFCIFSSHILYTNVCFACMSALSTVPNTPYLSLFLCKRNKLLCRHLV